MRNKKVKAARKQVSNFFNSMGYSLETIYQKRKNKKSKDGLFVTGPIKREEFCFKSTVKEALKTSPR